MAEITGVAAPAYVPPPPPPPESSPPPAAVEQAAPETTDLSAEMGVGGNIDVSA